MTDAGGLSPPPTVVFGKLRRVIPPSSRHWPIHEATPVLDAAPLVCHFERARFLPRNHALCTPHRTAPSHHRGHGSIDLLGVMPLLPHFSNYPACSKGRQSRQHFWRGLCRSPCWPRQCNEFSFGTCMYRRKSPHLPPSFPLRTFKQTSWCFFLSLWGLTSRSPSL